MKIYILETMQGPQVYKTFLEADRAGKQRVIKSFWAMYTSEKISKVLIDRITRGNYEGYQIETDCYSFHHSLVVSVGYLIFERAI